MRKLMLVGVAVVVVAALISGVWIFRWGTPPFVDAQPSTSPAFSMVCAAYPGEEEHCTRAAQEAAKRPLLTEAQRTEALPLWEQLDVTLHALHRIVGDAQQLVDVLAAKGYPNSKARVARPTDPAPEGTLLYAVPLGDHACALGHVNRGQGSPGQSMLTGRLPDGTCLDG